MEATAVNIPEEKQQRPQAGGSLALNSLLLCKHFFFHNGIVFLNHRFLKDAATAFQLQSFLLFAMLSMELRAMLMLGKCSTLSHLPSPARFILFKWL